jgi:hypothetical protein
MPNTSAGEKGMWTIFPGDIEISIIFKLLALQGVGCRYIPKETSVREKTISIH